MDYVLLPLKRYADFRGRSQRKEYWMYTLGVFIAAILTGIIDGVIGMAGMVGPYGPLTALLYLGTLVPSIAVAIRRMHDQDRSGWWILCPIANIIFLFIDGTPGPNRFGEDPKARVAETFA